MKTTPKPLAKPQSHSKTLYGKDDNNTPFVIESNVTFANNDKAANTWLQAMQGLISPQAGLELAPYPKERTHVVDHFELNDQRRTRRK